MGNQEYVKKTLPLVAALIGVIAIGIMVAAISPRYSRHNLRTEEAELRHDLAQVREALGKYHADAGKYPDALDELVQRHYLNRIPTDPLTRSSTSWVLVTPGPAESGISDVRSGAPGNAQDGTAYGEW
jgi:Tfp pilus assembly protein PilE